MDGSKRHLSARGLAVMKFWHVQALAPKFWIQGSVLGREGLSGTRTVDLSRAEITLGSVNPSDITMFIAPVVPVLIARDPGTGQKINVPLQSRNLAPLPPQELQLLADTILAARAGDESAQAVAAKLRAMANEPPRRWV